jgi:hypothetical protein
MPECTGATNVDGALRDLARGRSTQELIFDPRSGQLVVTSQPHPDDVIATDAAAGGYFA